MSRHDAFRPRTDRPKVVITDYDYGDVSVEREILEAVGAEVIALQAKHEDDLFDAAPHCAAMMNQYARIGRDTISRMRKCEVIARYGVGVDIVDVEAASERGILVTNVQNYCTEEVADHAISLWLALARKLPDYDRATHAGVWRWQSGQPVFLTLVILAALATTIDRIYLDRICAVPWRAPRGSAGRGTKVESDPERALHAGSAASRSMPSHRAASPIPPSRPGG